jgi:hypothetical protein
MEISNQIFHLNLRTKTKISVTQKDIKEILSYVSQYSKRLEPM